MSRPILCTSFLACFRYKVIRSRYQFEKTHPIQIDSLRNATNLGFGGRRQLNLARPAAALLTHHRHYSVSSVQMHCFKQDANQCRKLANASSGARFKRGLPILAGRIDHGACPKAKLVASSFSSTEGQRHSRQTAFWRLRSKPGV